MGSENSPYSGGPGMSLLRADSAVGASPSPGSIVEPVVGRESVRVAGGRDQSAVPSGLLTDDRFEPTVDARILAAALRPEDVEGLRPLLPVGYDVVVDAYKRA